MTITHSHNQGGLLKYFKRKDRNTTTNGGIKMNSDIDDSKDDDERHRKKGSEKCNFSVGITEDKNRKCRRTMEDAHTFIYNYLDKVDSGYFAVFDGHAGPAVADWCSKKMHGIVESCMETEETPVHALNAAFLEADNRIKADIRNSGSTAAVAITRWEENNSVHKLYCANVGDTRIVLSRQGKPLRLSYDHKGSDFHETKRVQNCGGIMMNNRVNGVLAVTRSLGDHYMKDYVTGAPYTTETILDDEKDEFIIIACDGLWDVCDDQTAVNLVREHTGGAQGASRALVDYALQNMSSDNLSCMVIKFNSSSNNYSTAINGSNTQGV